MTSKIPMTNEQARQLPYWSLVPGQLLVIGIWSLVIFGCGRSDVSIAARPPKIASLVPAATDLLVGMGAADHLVAVSNWDGDRPEIRHLPRVGDYQTTDWEKLSQLRPDVMIVFMAGDRMPPGLKQRADELGIRLVNVRIERLSDVFQTIDMLGELSDERDKAAELSARIRRQLDVVAQRVSQKEKVPTLVVCGEQGLALIAGDTFVDDLLAIAGGRNVAGGFPVRYPTVDRERIMELAPRAIVQLIPDATEQMIQQARRNWQKLPQVPAVRDGRVYILTDWYVLQPGSHVGDLAEQMARHLHPQS